MKETEHERNMKETYRKITVGYVIQNFDEKGRFLSQTFICGDDQTWENECGEPVAELPDAVVSAYHPYTMVLDTST